MIRLFGSSEHIAEEYKQASRELEAARASQEVLDNQKVHTPPPLTLTNPRIDYSEDELLARQGDPEAQARIYTEAAKAGALHNQRRKNAAARASDNAP